MPAIYYQLLWPKNDLATVLFVFAALWALDRYRKRWIDRDPKALDFFILGPNGYP